MKLTYPTRPELEARLAKRSPLRPDSLSHAERGTNGFDLTVTALDGTTALATFNGGPGEWHIAVQSPAFAKGERVRLPESLLVRLNRVLSTDGLVIRRDWRTKSHVLAAGKGRVLPLLNGERVSVQGPALIAARAVQAAPLPAPTQAASPLPAPLPVAQAEPAPKGPKVTLPAAYRGQHVVMTPENRQRWAQARAAVKAGAPDRVILFSGPSGAGKTHAVHDLAAAEGLPVVKFDASGVVEPADWFGTVTLDASGTKFQPSSFLTALTTPGARVLLIDEANRANGRAMNAVLPILDGSGSFIVPQDGQPRSVNPDVQIAFTANIGSEHLQVEPLDVAITTRIATTIELDHLSEDDERALLLSRVPGLSEYDAANLARLGALIRESAKTGAHGPVSTRQILAAAWQCAQPKADARIAVDACITDAFSAEGGEASERAAIRPHVAGIVWKKPRSAKRGTSSVLNPCANPECRHSAEAHGVSATTIAAAARCTEAGCTCTLFDGSVSA